MAERRLPAHLEVSGLIRAVDAAGGFAAVLQKGERDAGTLLILCVDRKTGTRAFERMPQADGSRSWMVSRVEDIENPQEFSDYIERRQKQDPDLWVLELDIADAERFVVESGTIR